MPAPEDDERQQQHRAGRGHRDARKGGFHYLVKNDEAAASSARVNDSASNSGTRNSRSLATRVSSSARSSPRIASLTTITSSPAARAVGAGDVAIPHGRNRFAASVSSNVRRTAAAHSINARYGPEYSRIIAS